MLSKTTKALLVGVALGFALSQLVSRASLRAAVRQREPTESSATRPTSNDIAFINLREDGGVEDYEAESYHADHDGLRKPAVASLHPGSDQEVTWEEYARVFAQRKEEAIVLTRTAGPGFQSRRVLLSAIVTSAKRIANGHTLALHGTWGAEASHLVFFAERDVATLPALPAGMDLVQMDQLDSAATWEEKELAVVRHLGALYCDRTIEGDRYDWFLVAPDVVYIVSHVLEKRLNQLDASLSTCLGVFGGDERSVFGGAAVYSNALMARLGLCFTRGGGGSVRACLATLGASCIEGNQAEGWFNVGTQTALPDTPSMLRTVVLYPMSSATHLYRVHTSLKHLQYNASLALAREAREAISNIMPLLPDQYQFAVPPVPATNSQLVPTSCVVIPRASYVPKSRYDLGYWEYFNQTRLMGVWRDSPSVGIAGDVREEAKTLLSNAILHATQAEGGKLVFDRLENGYRRVDVHRGSEYVFDLVFSGGGSHLSPRNAPIRRRVSLLRPYAEDTIPVPSAETSAKINLILTLCGYSDRLERFLAHYGEEVLGAESGGVSLTVVLYESPDSHIARKVLKHHSDVFPASAVSVIDGAGEFARGAGLHLASERFPGDQILFFVDVDLAVSAQAMRRCRLNAVLGRRVYFPVFFKLYNASFVGRHFKGVTRYLVARHNGHWAHYSYGAVCVYGDDYRRAGGFELGAKGWGNEDVDFLERTLKVGLEPFRAPDPGLIHNWHPKVCDRGALRDNQTYQDCLRSRGENLADRIELASYVLSLETEVAP